MVAPTRPCAQNDAVQQTVPLGDDPLLSAVPLVDGYKVLEPCVLYSKLGEGGMGAVYKGRHLNLEIDVAVKCLRQMLASQSQSFVQRFQREARLAAGIHHQNLVQVYDVSHRNGVHYLVMEFVCGETARDRVARKGALAVDEALRIALGAAGGLAEAHANRVVHRDVKPDNILISREGRVKVSDLGIAKAIESEHDAGLTQGVMGTPQYMAPEQWEDAAGVTPAADVWALGATLFYLLAGRDPIAAGTMQQVYRRVCVEPFPDIREVQANVPAEVARLIERCVARDLDRRFADCRQVLRELERMVDRDATTLAHDRTQDSRSGISLVSPPPPETLARIKVRVDSKVGPQGDDTLPWSPQGASAAPQEEVRRRRSSAWWMLGLALVTVITLAVFLVPRDLFERSPSEVGPNVSSAAPGALEPATAPRLVTPEDPDRTQEPGGQEEPSIPLDQVAPLIAPVGFVDTQVFVAQPAELVFDVRDEHVEAVTIGEQPLTRTGETWNWRAPALVEGDNPIHVRARDTAGNVGEWVGTVVLDTLPPALVGVPACTLGEHEPGARIAIELRFDTPVQAASIADAPAEIEDGHTARRTCEVPDDTSSWRVPWSAADEHGLVGSGELAVAVRAPKRSPQGYTPDGDRFVTVTVDGKVQQWAARVVDSDTGIVLVLIGPGTFLRGSEQGEIDARPVRDIEISRPFYLAEREVSTAQWARVMERRAPRPEEAELPVSGISWKQADDFCRRLGLRLPTEAEWEYACRAGTTGAFSFGDELSADEAATYDTRTGLKPGGSFAPNAWGLYDMHGNVMEWCEDAYSVGAYAGGDPVDPIVQDTQGVGDERVMRGGSYLSANAFCGSASRHHAGSAQRPPSTGLRVARDLP